ncbi:ABC transporter substrate-binding protein [Aerococcaceae bacterium zg-BR22]|uniref:ABC transporter substrate-binding protein n=1 Tax=Aerococcaceae bacterium zg-1292 TaxID=2774330 RepID=UPI0040634045|nr:ABC transporter substrate-binding protein [Aerococcaceae bacterium zg-BR22]
MFKLKKFNVVMVIVMVVASLLPLSVNAQEETIKIGILQTVEHEALDAVLKGFKETIEQSSLKGRVKWDVQNASGDMANLQSMSEKLARDNDILFAIATPAAQALATVETKKPIFIAAVTDPIEAGLAKSLEQPGRNVTGTSDMAPIEEQVALLTRNFPNVKKVGIIYNSSEINSVVLAELATKALKAASLAVESGTVTSTNDIAQVLTPLVEKVDAMFMVTDNTIDSSITLVGDIVKSAKIPMIGSSEPVVKANGLATLSNSYKDYGVQTAEMLIKMVEGNLNPAEMPIELANKLELVVNDAFAKAIGVNPASIK